MCQGAECNYHSLGTKTHNKLAYCFLNYVLDIKQPLGGDEVLINYPKHRLWVVRKCLSDLYFKETSERD